MSRCENRVEHCCDCPDRRSSDVSVALDHWLTNFEFQGWRLWYDRLESPGKDNCLCKCGRCRICGKCLCAGVVVPTDQGTDGFLASVYRWMYRLWHAEHRSHADFREMFTNVFHEEDRPLVRHWLTLPENQSVWQMHCHDGGGER